MRIIIVVLVLLVSTGIIHGCARFMSGEAESLKEEGNEVNYEGGEIDGAEFYEENYRILNDIFDTVADELKEFVAYLQEHNLLYTVDFKIVFPRDTTFPGENEWRIENRGDRGAISPLLDSDEFSDIIENISEKNIFRSISVRERLPNADVEISFVIRTTNTNLIQGNYGVEALFRYVEGEIDIEEFGWGRRIREGWYKDILPPPG